MNEINGISGSKTDSIRLLRETNAGIQMGVTTIDEIIKSIGDEGLRTVMSRAKAEHEKLGGEAHRLLHFYGSDTKEPHPVAKFMSSVKTNVKLAAEPDDKTAAELITDGCNMGIKNLNKYLNEYGKASPLVSALTRRVIRSEEKLCDDVKQYL